MLDFYCFVNFRINANGLLFAFLFFLPAEEVVNVIVEGGAVPALVKHLQAPPCEDGDRSPKPFEHEVEKGSAFALGLLAVKVILLNNSLLYIKNTCYYYFIYFCLVVTGIYVVNYLLELFRDMDDIFNFPFSSIRKYLRFYIKFILY